MSNAGTVERSQALDHKIITGVRDIINDIKQKHKVDVDGDDITEQLDEEGNLKNIDQLIDDDDSDIIRIKLTKFLAEQLFDETEQKDMQISRLSTKQITWLTWMKFTDKALGFDLYDDYAKALRVHQISFMGLSRNEVVQLVKAMSTTETFMPESEGGRRGLLSSIKNRLFG